jgi:hypothetical protein
LNTLALGGFTIINIELFYVNTAEGTIQGEHAGHTSNKHWLDH